MNIKKGASGDVSITKSTFCLDESILMVSSDMNAGRLCGLMRPWSICC
ncbi:hypothetical protein [Rhodohalobacter barkolensis]|nr:hypothetical protein [Rhodohalobacter barkolensis]